MKLKEFQNKHHIRRIEFDNVKLVDEIEEYGTDQLICPYCGAVNEYEAESIDEIVRGTPWQCRECEKWFYAEGEFSMETTCTPIENKVLEPFTRGSIERAYKHMDECAECGCEWESPFGVVEFTTYKEFAEPLFENERNGERAQLRGRPLDEDCKRAVTTKHEYGPEDNRVFCCGVCNGYGDVEVAEKCRECKAYAYNAEPWKGENDV